MQACACGHRDVADVGVDRGRSASDPISLGAVMLAPVVAARHDDRAALRSGGEAWPKASQASSGDRRSDGTDHRCGSCIRGVRFLVPQPLNPVRAGSMTAGWEG